MEVLYAVLCSLLGIAVGITVGQVCVVIINYVDAWREAEREADFFEPVEYPTMEQVEARKAAREYRERITSEP